MRVTVTCNKGALKPFAAFLLVLTLLVFLAFSMHASSQESPSGQVIDGDSVYWENDYGIINVTPHTSTCYYGSGQDTCMHTQVLEVTSKLAGTNDIDFAFEFDFPVTGGMKLLSNERLVEVVYVNESGNETVVNETVYDETDITHLLTHTKRNGKHFYWISEVSFDQFESKKVRMYYEVPINESGKYDLWVKRSVDTIDDVLDSGLYVHLDPWFNNFYGLAVKLTGRAGQYLDTEAEKFSYEFTAQNDKNITQACVSVGIVTGTPPAYYVGLQADAGNDTPDGMWLGGSNQAYGILEGAEIDVGVFECVNLIENASLTPGSKYHVVVEYGNGTINGSNRIYAQYLSGEEVNAYLVNGTADAALDTLYTSDNGSSWSATASEYPIFGFVYDDGSNFSTGSAYYAISVTRDTGTEDAAGQNFTFSEGADYNVSSYEIYMYATGDPTGVEVEVRGPDRSVLDSCTFDPGSADWYGCNATDLNLTDGESYIIDVRCTGCGDADYVRVHQITTGSGADFQNWTYNANTSFYVESADNASTWTNDVDDDALFRINASEIGASTTTTSLPSIGVPVINSSSGTNTTDENLTCTNTSLDPSNLTSIYTWQKNNTELLRAYWSMDASDSVANYVNLSDNFTNNGAAYTTSGCVVGSCYDLEGSENDDMTVADPFHLANFTWNYWVKHESFASNGNSMFHFSKYSDADNDELILGETTDGTSYRFGCGWENGGTSEIYYVDNVSLDANSWAMVTCSYDNGTNAMNLYFNGTWYTENTTTNDPPDVSDDLVLGDYMGSENNLDYDGVIDEALVFNYTLTEGQVYALYNAFVADQGFYLLNGSETESGDVWTCKTRPLVDDDLGAIQTSDSLTIGATTTTTSIPLSIDAVQANVSSGSNVSQDEAIRFEAEYTNSSAGLDDDFAFIEFNGSNFTASANETHIYWDWDDTGNETGKYEFTHVFGNDSDGYASLASTIYVNVTDTPVVSLDDPSDGDKSLENRSLNFTFHVESNSSIDNCTVYHNMSGTWTDNESLSSPANGTHGVIVDSSNAFFVWNVECYGGGNEGLAASNYSAEVTVTGEVSVNGSNITDDAMFDEDSSRSGIEDSMIADVIDNTGELSIIKIDISGVPAGKQIDNVTGCFWEWADSDEELDVWHSTNQTWVEEDIDDLCSGGAYCSEVEGLFDTLLTVHMGDNNTAWDCITGIEEGVESDYNESNTYSSFVFNVSGTDAADFYQWRTKEYATESRRPYFNISYSSTEGVTTTSTTTTIPLSLDSTNVNVTDGSNITPDDALMFCGEYTNSSDGLDDDFAYIEFNGSNQSASIINTSDICWEWDQAGNASGRYEFTHVFANDSIDSVSISSTFVVNVTTSTTTSLPASTCVEINISDDTFIRGGSYSGVNQDEDPEGLLCKEHISSVSFRRKPLIMVNQSGQTGLPQNATVEDANISLYLYNVGDQTTNYSYISVYNTTTDWFNDTEGDGNWTEDEVFWDSAPVADVVVENQTVYNETGRYVHFTNLSGQFRYDFEDGNNLSTFLFELDDQSDDPGSVFYFNSTENEVGGYPYATVCYSNVTTSSTTSTSTTSTSSTSTSTTLPAGSHPRLLFSDITDTSCYHYQASAPCSSLISTVNSSSSMHNKALMYLLDSESSDLDDATTGLKTFDTAATTRYYPDGLDLLSACLAYDWVQPHLSTSDDEEIRDRIATLADALYQESSEWSMAYVDYHGKVFPGLGCAGVVLSDYTDSLTYGSTPSDWLAIGTTNWFDVDTHTTSPLSQGTIYYQYGPRGYSQLPGYNHYVYGSEVVWDKIYANSVGGLPQVAKDAVLANYLWGTFPNTVSTTRGSSGSVIWGYPYGLLDQLNTSERSWAIQFYNNAQNEDTFPRRELVSDIIYSYSGDAPISYPAVHFATMPNATNETATDPSDTARLYNDSLLQSFRNGWTYNATAALLTTHNGEILTKSGRAMSHAEQLHFEYFDKGDSLIGDGGEIKSRRRGYGGVFGLNHAGFLFTEDADDQLYVRKGTATASVSVINPSTVTYHLTEDDFDFVEATLSDVESMGNHTRNDGAGSTVEITEPLEVHRLLAFPAKEYFVLFDYANTTLDQEAILNFPLQSGNFNTSNTYYSSQVSYSLSPTSPISFSITVSSINHPQAGWRSWVDSVSSSGTAEIWINGNNVGDIEIASGGREWIQGFNSSALVVGSNSIVINTTDATGQLGYALSGRQPGQIIDIGMVNGDLEVEGAHVNWENQTYRTPSTKTEGNDVRWNTTTPYGNRASMQLYTSPKANITYQKNWVKIGGTSGSEELDAPVVQMTRNTSGPMRSVSIVYTLNEEDPYWTVTDLATAEDNWSGVKLDNGTWEDVHLHGNGSFLQAGGVETDANRSSMRDEGGLSYFFVRDATNYSFNDTDYFTANRTLDYGLVSLNGSNVTFTADGVSDTNVTLRVPCAAGTQVFKDGGSLSTEQWACVDTNNVWINTSYSSLSQYVVYGSGGAPEESDPTSPTVTVNAPASLNYTNDTLTADLFNFSAVEDNSTSMNCTLFLDSEPAANNASVFNNTATLLTSNLSLGEGNYTWTVNCSDAATNDGVSSTYYLNVDNETPTAAINGPANATWGTTATQEFNVTVTDDMSELFACYVDFGGTHAGNASNLENNTIQNVSVSGLTENATRDWTVNCSDAVGYEDRVTDLYLFYTDLEDPNVTSNTPSQYNTSATQEVTLNYTVNDTISDSLNCTLLLNETANESHAARSNNTQYNFTQTYAYGVWNWSVSCSDESGRTNDTESFNFTMNAGNTPPETINVTSPSNESTSWDDTPQFDWAKGDDDENATIYYHLQVDDDEDFSSVTVEKTNLSDDTYNFTGDDILTTGDYYWRVRGNDQVAYGPWSDLYVLGVDVSAPTISTYTPTNDSDLANGTESTTVNISLNEQCVCEYNESERFTYGNGTDFDNTNDTWSSYTRTGLQNGTSYYAYISCQDLYNNTMTANVLHFYTVAGTADVPGGGGGGGGGGVQPLGDLTVSLAREAPMPIVEGVYEDASQDSETPLTASAAGESPTQTVNFIYKDRSQEIIHIQEVEYDVQGYYISPLADIRRNLTAGERYTLQVTDADGEVTDERSVYVVEERPDTLLVPNYLEYTLTGSLDEEVCQTVRNVIADPRCQYVLEVDNQSYGDVNVSVASDDNKSFDVCVSGQPDELRPVYRMITAPYCPGVDGIGVRVNKLSCTTFGFGLLQGTFELFGWRGCRASAAPLLAGLYAVCVLASSYYPTRRSGKLKPNLKKATVYFVAVLAAVWLIDDVIGFTYSSLEALI